MNQKGVGASITRKEDDRFLRGRGQFVGDIKLARMLDAAFVRSPVAHGSLKSIDIPNSFKDSVFTSNDLNNVKPIRAVSGLNGLKA